MLKVAMLAGVIAAMAMSGNLAEGSSAVKTKKLDAQIIVEVDRDQETLTEEGIKNTQQTVLNNIKSYATKNVRLISSYSHILNAFAISINKDDIELVKKVPGVKGVTLNELHWKTEATTDGAIPLGEGGGTVTGEYGGEENISAETMGKPEETNDGEGTTIAVLDNEFFFRGQYSNGAGGYNPAWNHETFTALDSTVSVKHSKLPDGSKRTFAYKYAKSEVLGREGSLYFNSKVPFYFDYGGEIEIYSADPTPDLDVSSELSYHGSHVASIATGNAPTYKGIAPKAQLIAMKVFTNYKASKIDKFMGLQNYSGAYDLPILNALEDCMILNVDGINMSLGSNLDDFDKDSATRKVLNKLAESGIMTSISAGNSGKTSFSSTGAYANWTKEMVETGILSGYANESSAMTIAAGQPTQIFYETGFDLDDSNVAYADQIVNTEGWGDDYDVEYKMEDIFDDGTKTYSKSVDWVYVPGFGRSSDYKGLNVNGKIAVVNRGSTNFSDKYAQAKNKGAVAIVIINNDPTASDFNFRCSFGDDFTPTMPCALVLYKDKQLFEQKKSGTINLIRKKLVDNPNAYTVSSFSTDGATYDLDLKPEITAPGENIRGAVPPQKTEDRVEERRYGVYEYLSGTSMSAPNYAGCQSLILSKFAAQYYKNGKTPSKSQRALIDEYRETVDMRLMSTADPMKDVKGTDGTEPNVTSPRKQGAGMVDLEDAYNTDTYLEGLDLQGNPIGKSKICLRNNADINKGDIKLSFLAHNESLQAHTYNVKLSVMRPATANTQDIVLKKYNDCGTVDNILNFPGHSYATTEVVEGQLVVVMKETDGVAKHNDVYKVTREISYPASIEAYGDESKYTKIPMGRYINVGDETNPQWEDYETYEYQSVKDTTIATVDLGELVINPGENTINLATYSLTKEAKDEIAKIYEYGCFIEGYVTLENKEAEGIDLSIPYMGFYSSLNETGGSYEDCPVSEPFSFDKNENTVYPSDLVNDITKSLLGKEKHDMGSMWVAGYLAPGQEVNVENILKNDDNFANLSGFHLVGTDPITGEFYSDVRNNIYVGNANSTNTMIIQKFMLRSVANNYFTIRNAQTKQVVYKSVLEDMLYGEQGGKYPLYKSHVDENYLGAGYVAHRAYGVIPLYNPDTGVAFPSGKYEITFNYLLAGTNTWVDESYNINIDSDSPEVSSITTSGNKVTINVKEANLVQAQVGKNVYQFTKTGSDTAKIELTKEEINDAIEENMNEYQGTGRLYIKLIDKAYGEQGVVVRFKAKYNSEGDVEEYILNNYVMIQHYSLTYNHDFEDDGASIQVVLYNPGTRVEKDVTLDGFVLSSRGPVKYASVTNGCGGNIAMTSGALSAIALIGFAILLISKKKRKLGGKF